MDYTDYAKEHPGMSKDEKKEIVRKYCQDLADGRLSEVIKFFNLDDEDISELKKDNFTVGYNIVSDEPVKDEEGNERKSLNVNIRLDVKVEEYVPDMDSVSPTPVEPVHDEETPSPEVTSGETVDASAVEVTNDPVEEVPSENAVEGNGEEAASVVEE